MAEETRRNEPTQIRDPKTGKLLARVDHDRQKVELHVYRHGRVWVNLGEFVDKKADRG